MHRRHRRPPWASWWTWRARMRRVWHAWAPSFPGARERRGRLACAGRSGHHLISFGHLTMFTKNATWRIALDTAREGHVGLDAETVPPHPQGGQILPEQEPQRPDRGDQDGVSGERGGDRRGRRAEENRPGEGRAGPHARVHRVGSGLEQMGRVPEGAVRRHVKPTFNQAATRGSLGEAQIEHLRQTF